MPERHVRRIRDVGEFVREVIAEVTAAHPLSPRPDCPVCRDVPPVVTEDDAFPAVAEAEPGLDRLTARLDRLKDIVRADPYGNNALRECPQCRRLYWYTYWFKMGETSESTLHEIDSAQAVEKLGSAATGRWALRREDGLWILGYIPSAEELGSLLSPREHEELRTELEGLASFDPFRSGFARQSLERRLHELEWAETEPRLTALQDPRLWLLLDPVRGCYLRRSARLGWEAVLWERNQTLKIWFWSDERVQLGVMQAIEGRPNASLEPADTKALRRLERIEPVVEEALARIAAGEAWPSALGELVAVAGRFYAVRESAREATLLDRQGVLERLMDRALRSRRRPPLPTQPLPPGRRDELASRLDAARQLELMRQERLAVGGGPHTDMQWNLRCVDGRFIRSTSSALETVTETEARSILEQGRYEWLQWT